MQLRQEIVHERGNTRKTRTLKTMQKKTSEKFTLASRVLGLGLGIEVLVNIIELTRAQSVRLYGL